MTSSWALAVARDDLYQTALLEGPVPEIGDGEVLLRVDRAGVTANNVTYALLGDSFRWAGVAGRRRRRPATRGDPGRQAGLGAVTGTLFVRATSAYQRALRFGIRRWVPKSTKTSPNRLEYPSAHSKLSRNDQTK
jgi:hypothetical protein